MTRRIYLSWVFLSLSLLVFSQPVENKGLNAITENAVKAQLEFLSSDWMEGRGTGTRGAYMAAEYIASMFKLYGLEPGGDAVAPQISRREMARGRSSQPYRDYFQNFQLIEYSLSDDQSLSLVEYGKDSESGINFSYHTDFSVSPGAVSQSGKSGIIFVGYGLKDIEKNYNDFYKQEVKGKIVMRIAGYPGHKDPESEAYKKFKPENRWQEYRMRSAGNETAVEYGAIAVLEVFTDDYDLSSWAENIPFHYNSPMYEGDERQPTFYDTRMTLPGDSLETGIPVFTISLRMANEILDGTGISLVDFEEQVAKSGKPASKYLGDKEVKFETRVNSRIINARNVIGVLKGKDNANIIVVGGHYDHLGKHKGYIWNGADDNASGTVGVMTLAKACMAAGEKPEKTIVFAAWTGEEKGLWGSKYFADHPIDDSKMILNLNFDMISRDNEDDENGTKCSMNYPADFSAIKEVTKENANKYDLDLDISYRATATARGGSDHAPFAQKGIPYFYFMAGFPPEYHQPDDHVELANIPKMTDIIRLGFLNIWQFANSNEWIK